MTLPIEITTREEYDLTRSYGHEPLQDWKKFKLDISLRVVLQKEIFGKCEIGRGNIPQANQRFYKYCWHINHKRCEECGKPLGEFSSVFISHILTRGAHPEMAHDPRNKNLFCFKHHEQWENGKREQMRIYKTNLKVIELLKLDYQ